MAKNKIVFDFKALEEYAEKLDKIGGDIREATENALEECHGYITSKIESDIRRHRQTGETEASLDRQGKVVWEGSVAEIPVGFRISEGGLPSIFLMYGTPKMKKDQKLYNDLYGSATKKEVKEIQERSFEKVIKDRMKG